MEYGFIIGNLLGRVCGPIAQDWIQYRTFDQNVISQKKWEKERRSKQAELEDRIKLSNIDHQQKLEALRIQFEQNRQKAEEQMVLSYSEWQQKMFWEKCFPLRNPFEIPFGVKLEYQESSQRLKGCSLTTITLPNKQQIVPLRVILASKDNVHPHASTVSAELSMHLSQHFSANSCHAVISEIGAWKEDAPINDASVNYLFRGQRGLPTLVVAPSYTNNGSILRLKLWSWGLGEDLAYPVGFDFGWFNIELLQKKILIQEIKAFDETLKKLNISRPTPYQVFEENLKIIKLIEKDGNLTAQDRDQLTYLLQKTPPEIASIVNRKTNEIVSTIYSCAVSMYADGFHLNQYGTLPKLPKILAYLPGAEMILPQVLQYYMALIEFSAIKGVIAKENLIEVQLELAESINQISPHHESLLYLIDNIRLLNADNKKNHKQCLERLRSITQTNTKLLNG